MVEENRKFLFKQNDSSLSEIRDKSREVTLGIRKDRREKIVSTKRFRNDKYTNKPTDKAQYNVTKVRNVAGYIQKKSAQTEEQLKFLRNAFSFTSEFAEAFLEVDNALQALVGYLTGNEATLQLEAAWCITNITANDHKDMFVVVKAVAPYLITYLQSGSVLLQDQSAWALGNIAADSDEIRELLKTQGAVLPLIHLMKSDSDAVVQAAVFALCNMSRSFNLVLPEFQSSDIKNCVLGKLSNKGLDINVLCEVAWLLTYFSTNDEMFEFYMKNGVLEHLTYWLCKVRPHQQEYFFAVTPLLRCLGNFVGHGDDVPADVILHYENGLILSTLNSFLMSNKRYLIKECLWVIANIFASTINFEGSTDEIKLMITNITRHLNSAYEIKKEAAICMYNIACRDEPSYMELIIDRKVFEFLIAFFKVPDVDIVVSALHFFELALQNDTAQKMFYDLEGPSYLEALEYNENEELRTIAVFLQKTYYENDDGDDEHRTNGKAVR